jgi:hypothetical protein
MPDRLVGQVAVCFHVNLDNKLWEEDVHSELVHPNVTTSMLTLMGAEAVQRVAQGGDVKIIANQNKLPVNGNDGRAGTKDWGEQVVAHADVAAIGGLV